MTKIAVIGGGFFGSCISLKLKEKNSNFHIDLFERGNDLLQGTSGKNQFRCHRGYHYPRSKKTYLECQKSYFGFKKMFKDSFEESDNYYAISKNNSKTTFNEYINFLEDVNLKYQITNNALIKDEMVEGVVKVPEYLININKARNILKKRIEKLNINLYLNHEIALDKDFKNKYDFVILATYENNNLLKNNIGIKTDKYFYQLVEKIIIKRPKIFDRFSCVVIDGDFVSIDPYSRDFHVIGHVKKSVISKSNTKKGFKISRELDELVKKYDVNEINRTLFSDIKKDFVKYFNNFENTQYFRSFFVIRCTKKNKDDERTTNIDFHKNIISVHSGKWINCVEAGTEISRFI